MTDKNNNNPTRSKLTLKLSPSVTSNSNTTTNNSNDKKSSHSVQVTIKGRKNPQKDSFNLNSKDLNKNELEARMKAISKDASKTAESDIKTHEILSKITKENRQNEAEALEKQASAIIEENQKVEISSEIIEPIVVEETKVKSTLTLENRELDGFDVRNKIKQSLQIANKQKEEL
jgi:trimethylamine:corrinoid methyltransferase-like protein